MRAWSCSAGSTTLRNSRSAPSAAHAGVSARYFYESFTDKDDFVAAVFDWVIADIAATTQAAVAAAPRDEQNRAGIANLVRTIADDARVGRLLFNPALSNAVLARKRAELGGVFALLSGQHVTSAFRLPENPRIKVARAFRRRRRQPDDQRMGVGRHPARSAQLVEQLTRIVDDIARRR